MNPSVATTTETTQYVPLLAAELPPGWTISEEMWFTSPTGTEMQVHLGRTPEGQDSADAAAAQEALLRAEATGLGTVRVSTMARAVDTVAHQLDFDLQIGDAPSLGRITCWTDGGLSVLVRAAWAAGDDVAAAEADTLVRGIRVLGGSHPTALGEEVGTDAGDAADRPTQPSGAPQRSPVDPAEWARLRARWSTCDAAESETAHTTRWSALELTLAAGVVGAPGFPGVAPELVSGLPANARDAVFDTITASFVARGLVRNNDERGVTELDGVLREIVDLGAFPDLVISAERYSHSLGNDWVWLGLRTDAAIVVTIRSGGFECRTMSSEEVVPHLLAMMGVHPAAVAPGPTDFNGAELRLQDLTEGTGPVASLWRLQSSWRTSTTLEGGLFWWGVGADGSTLLLDERPGADEEPLSWEIQTVTGAAVRDQLLDHLPGG